MNLKYESNLPQIMSVRRSQAEVKEKCENGNLEGNGRRPKPVGPHLADNNRWGQLASPPSERASPM